MTIFVVERACCNAVLFHCHQVFFTFLRSSDGRWPNLQIPTWRSSLISITLPCTSNSALLKEPVQKPLQVWSDTPWPQTVMRSKFANQLAHLCLTYSAVNCPHRLSRLSVSPRTNLVPSLQKSISSAGFLAFLDLSNHVLTARLVT